MTPDFSHSIKIRVVPLNFFLLHPDFEMSGRNTNVFLMGPILFLYYEESLVSSNLNSKLLWFHNVRPTLHIYQPEARCQYQ